MLVSLAWVSRAQSAVCWAGESGVDEGRGGGQRERRLEEREGLSPGILILF